MGKDHDKVINEMSLGMDSSAAFSEADDMDMDPEMDAAVASLGPESSDLGPDLEDQANMVEVDREELRKVLSDVEMGEVSADEAYENLCGGCDDGDMGLDSDLDMGDDMDDEMLGEVDFCSVNRIANMLTEDPDVMEDEESKSKKCEKCGCDSGDCGCE